MSTRIWGPPSNLRLVVVDLETCVAPDRGHRIVALGAVLCRAGGIKQRRSWLVDPGVPVDAYTTTIHHLNDGHLADEPPFDEVLPEFLRMLVPRPGETVVLAAHQAAFDVTVLRKEIARVGGSPLPDLPVLDTAGSLPRLAGLTVRRRRLEDLLAALGLTNLAPHDALGDAWATALAACALLDQCPHDDVASLLAALGGATTATVKPATASRATSIARLAVPLPLPHVETHARVFPVAPTQADLDEWRDMVAECARLRCDGLAGRADAIPAVAFRGLLFAALADAAAAGDAAGVATLLGALAPLLETMPDVLAEMRAEVPALPRIAGARNSRGVALALATWLEGVLASVPRCADADPCPACREGQACPRDTWPSVLVPAILATTEREVVGIWNPRGLVTTSQSKGSGRGYAAIRRVHVGLADAVLRACYAYWIGENDPANAAHLVDQVWRQAGCRDPFIAEMRATQTAAGGRPADLRAALRDCRTVLAGRNGNTDPAWASLETRAALFEGRLARLANPSVRRHFPANPVRPARPPRFLRIA